MDDTILGLVFLHHLHHGLLSTSSSSMGLSLLCCHPDASPPIMASPFDGFVLHCCFQPKSFALCKDGCDEEQEIAVGSSEVLF